MDHNLPQRSPQQQPPQDLPQPGLSIPQTTVHEHYARPRSLWPLAFAVVCLAMIGAGLTVAWKMLETAGRVA